MESFRYKEKRRAALAARASQYLQLDPNSANLEEGTTPAPATPASGYISKYLRNRDTSLTSDGQTRYKTYHI